MSASCVLGDMYYLGPIIHTGTIVTYRGVEVIFQPFKHNDLSKQRWYLQGTTRTKIVWGKNKS